MKYAGTCEIACGSEIRLRRVKERILFHIATEEQYFTIYEVNYFTFGASRIFHLKNERIYDIINVEKRYCYGGIKAS